MSTLITAFAIAGMAVAAAAGAAGHTAVAFGVLLVACTPWTIYQLIGPARFSLAEDTRRELEQNLRAELPELPLETGHGTLRVTAQAVAKGQIGERTVHVMLEKQDGWRRRFVRVQLRSPYALRLRLEWRHGQPSTAGSEVPDQDAVDLLAGVSGLGEFLAAGLDGSGLVEGELLIHRHGCAVTRAEVEALMRLAQRVDAHLEAPLAILRERGLHESESVGRQVLQGLLWRVTLQDGTQRLERRLGVDLEIRAGSGGQTGNPVVDMLLCVTGSAASRLGEEAVTERLLSVFHGRGDTAVRGGWLTRTGPAIRYRLIPEMDDLESVAAWLEDRCG